MQIDRNLRREQQGSSYRAYPLQYFSRKHAQHKNQTYNIKIIDLRHRGEIINNLKL